MAGLDGDALAVAYADGDVLERLPDELRALVGSPPWIAAQLSTADDAVRLQAQWPPGSRSAYRPRLLREVPSGAILAVSFKDFPRFGKGEGVAYVVPSALIPIVVLMVDSPTPAAVARALEDTAADIRDETGGALAMHVLTRGNRVVLTNGLGPAPTTGGLLVDDPPFKEALAATDVPKDVTWLAYADIQRLMPLLRILSRDLPEVVGADTLVAFGTPSGLEARLTRR